MKFFQDPIVIALLVLAVLGVFIALRPRRRPGIWLLLLTVMLFALPRAGVVIQQVSLPLPLAHVLAALFMLEWFLLRRTRMVDRSKVSVFVLLYGSVAALGLVIGLTAGGNLVVGFLELCFYLFSLGLYFYASDTFCTREHFTLFAQIVLVLSVIVSLYGVAQKSLGPELLVDNVTYTSAGDTARSYVSEGDPATRRVLSSYGDPNVLSTQLIFFVAIGFALLIGKQVPSYVRLLCIVVVGTNVLCILYTGSRAGKVSLVLVALGVMCWRSRWALRLLLPTAIVAAIIVGPQLLESALASRTGGLVSIADARQQYPRMLWQLLQAAPVGCGFGNTVQLTAGNMGWAFEVTQAQVIWAGFNSFWINLFSRLGAPGVVSLILLIIVLTVHIIRQVKRVQVGWVRAFVVGALLAFGCQWLVGLVNNTYMLPGGALNYWFMMGMVVAGCRAYALQPYPAMLPVANAWPKRPPSSAAPAPG